MTFDVNKMIQQQNDDFEKTSKFFVDMKEILKLDVATLLLAIYNTSTTVAGLVDVTKSFIELGEKGLVSIEHKGKEARNLVAVFETYQAGLHDKLDAGVSTIEELQELIDGAHFAFNFILRQNAELNRFNTLQIDKIKALV